MSITQKLAGEWSVLSFDTDRIKKYVFMTSKLKEIRGASALLNELNCFRLPQIINAIGQGWKDGPVVYSAGGSCTAIVPSGVAEEIIVQVENLYRDYTITASITGVSFQTDKKTIINDFGGIIKELGRMLQEKKAVKNQCEAAGIPGYVKFCESCSVYPAEEVDPLDEVWLCGSCSIKRKANEENRDDFWQQFCEYYDKHDEVAKITSLNDMGGANNYLGFISCDGNNMGKVVESLRSPQEFSTFATGMGDLMKKVTYKALADYIQPVKAVDKTVMPFQIFLMGGDDLIMAVPAHVALEVTLQIIREFEEGSKVVLRNIGGTNYDSLSMGAGVVFGPIKYPFDNFNRLAEQLQKSAKRKCALTGIYSGVIDYQVFSGSGFADLEDIRGQQLAYLGADKIPVKLTMRPYFHDDIEKILTYRDQLKAAQFPKSRLNKLYDQLYINRQTATLGTAMALTRCKPKQAEVFRDFLKDFNSYQLMPWTLESDGIYYSPLGDLVEIYDF